jgi:hypothetical protein
MLILSDGAQTSGDALQAAEFAASLDIQIVTVPFIAGQEREALVTAVDAPSHLRPGENFDLNVTLQSNEPSRAVIRILTGSEVAYEGSHDLRRGLQTLSLPLTAGSPGFIRYQVQITPSLDGYYQNNRLDAFSQVKGPPHILVVAPAPGEVLPNGETRPDSIRRWFGFWKRRLHSGCGCPSLA